MYVVHIYIHIHIIYIYMYICIYIYIFPGIPITHKALIKTRCYQEDEEKENKEALEKILKQLPKRLSSAQTKKIKQKYNVRLPRGRRKALQKELFPTLQERKDFEEAVGYQVHKTLILSTKIL